jgi:hypothetical protein
MSHGAHYRLNCLSEFRAVTTGWRAGIDAQLHGRRQIPHGGPRQAALHLEAPPIFVPGKAHIKAVPCCVVQLVLPPAAALAGTGHTTLPSVRVHVTVRVRHRLPGFPVQEVRESHGTSTAPLAQPSSQLRPVGVSFFSG